MKGYNNNIEQKNQEIWNYKLKLLKEIIHKNTRIIDIGSSNSLFKANPEGKEIYCLDIDKNALEVVKSKGLIPVEHDLNSKKKLPFKDNYFDVIILFDIIEHIADPLYVIEECKRIGKDGCEIIIGIPNSMNFMNRFTFLFGKTDDVTDTNHFFKEEILSDHLQLYSLKKSKCLLKKTGLKICKQYYYLQKSIRHKNLSFLQMGLSFAHMIKLHRLWPELFSFAFLFICRKKKGEK